ncbi:hypothetical protein HF319_07590, partial [Xanthomonas sp. Kuri4-1]
VPRRVHRRRRPPARAPGRCRGRGQRAELEQLRRPDRPGQRPAVAHPRLGHRLRLRRRLRRRGPDHREHRRPRRPGRGAERAGAARRLPQRAPTRPPGHALHPHRQRGALQGLLHRGHRRFHLRRRHRTVRRLRDRLQRRAGLRHRRLHPAGPALRLRVPARAAARRGHRHHLPRPAWRPYARTVFLDSDLGAHIAPAGWHDWDKPGAQATSYYGEFGSKGAGAAPEQRVRWAHHLSGDEAAAYTDDAILGDWQPFRAR